MGATVPVHCSFSCAGLGMLEEQRKMCCGTEAAFLKLKISVDIYRESPPSQSRIFTWYLKCCCIAVICVSATHPLTLCFSEADELFYLEIPEEANPWRSQNFVLLLCAILVTETDWRSFV